MSPFHFVLVFAFLRLASPCHAGGPREVFDVGFPCHSACVFLKIGNWSIFVLFQCRFVLRIIMKCHRDSGINKAASLLLVIYAIVSNTNDLLDRQTCQGIVSPPSHLKVLT